MKPPARALSRAASGLPNLRPAPQAARARANTIGRPCMTSEALASLYSAPTATLYTHEPCELGPEIRVSEAL